MAIAIATSPALNSGFGANAETTSFTPPAGSFLVAAVLSTATITGGALTWTERVVDETEFLRIYTTPITVSAPLTASANNGSGIGAIKLWVVTGQHPTTPIGATGAGSTTTNNATINAYTSTAGGSRGFLLAADFSASGLPTSTDDEEGFDLAGVMSGLAATKAANSGGSGTAVTFNADAGGTGSTDWAWVALEIVPALDVSRPIRATRVGQAVSRATIR